ncbi:MAG: M23 family metallopeptidase [Defluviitaleaceae bacterium]|nr:M23 family metallopeptidase [Defluviitaleaceae bacterium]
MAEKPKNAKQRGKGFFVAVYSGIGGLLILAVAIGYYSLIGSGASADLPNMDNVFGEAGLPVSGNMDVPVANIPTPTTPAQTQPERSDPEARRPSEQEPLPNEQNGSPPADEPGPEAYAPEPPDEMHMHQVLEPQGPNFVSFTEDDDMHWPVLGEIVMDFSMDAHIFDVTLDQWRVNDSISIRASRGEPVRAAAAGIVYEAHSSLQFGQVVVIDHGNGWLTTYRQLDPDTAVAVGDVVNRGQIIGSVGAPTIFSSELGYHVGFNVRNHGSPINPHAILATH